MASNEWLVRKLHEQDKKIEALSRGGTGVGHTSIAPGENLTVISDNGEVVLGAGGVEHVDGPTPATPSAPTLKLGFGTIETTWDGTFAEGEDEDGVPLTAPVDFDVVEVHCSTDPEEEEWGEDTMRGQIKTREGGTITVGGFDVDDEVFVCLIALAKTGKRSAPSATASLVIEGLDFSQLFTEIDAANATIKNAGEVLVTEQGTLDEKLTSVDGTLNDLGQDLAAVEDAQAQLNTDLSDVMTSVDGKNTITWNPSAPSKVSNPGKAVGDLWYRTSGNNIIGFWKWDGTDWVTQLLDVTTIPLIDIGAGTFGSLSGSRLEVGSVTADRVLVGVAGNIIPWSPVVSTEPHESRYGTVLEGFLHPSAGSAMRVRGGTRTDGELLQCLLLQPGNVIPGISSTNQGLPVESGRSYLVTAGMFIMGTPSVSNASVRYRANWRDGNGSYLSASTSSPVSLGGASSPVVWDVVPPAGAAFMQLHVDKNFWSSGDLVIVSPSLRLKTGATLIENGAITTDKLSANVLEVGNLKAGTAAINEAVVNKLWAEAVVAKMVTASEFIGENAILTGAVTAPKITASEELWAKIAQFVEIRAEHIAADAIDGMVITGATIRSAATGARTLMSASGFEAYDNAGKRTFFASASTGNVSMTGELYTGESGSERVVLDNSLWNSVQITDPDTGTLTNVPGAGVRIGVSSSSGADIYHGATTASGGRYVDQAVFRGPSGRARTVYGSASAGGGFPASSHVLSIADDASGVVAAECLVTSSGVGSATRKVELIGADANGNSRALIRASGGNGKSNMWGLDANGVEASEVASDGLNRSAWLGGKDSSGAFTAYVASFGNGGTTEINGSGQRPLNINHTGGSDWWFVPFRKSGTEWGYVGSTGAMGVNDFGVQSAAGKNLVLTTTTGSAGIVAKTNGDVTFSDSKGVNFSNIPVNNGTGVNVTAGGWFQKNTSSLRYKTDINPVDVSGFDVLSLEPKSFVYKDQKARFEKPRDEWGEYEEEIFANGLPTSYGLIAEEVEAAGGEFVVNYDQEGLPDSLNYGLIGVALIPTVRDLRDRITELERQLNE